MTHASLFSGIGGFDLAAQWMGWENVFHCERDPFCQKVLAHHFPNSIPHDDVTTLQADEYRGRIDVLSGGFPCQPFSVAGKRKGTEDERHLWPEMLRIIGESQPRWVVGENVRGLVSWSDGLVLEACYSDLENLGYSVQSFIIPACATGAPHRRDRVWIVAYSNNDRHKANKGEIRKEDKIQRINRSEVGGGVFDGAYLSRNAPDTNNPRTIERVRDNGKRQEKDEGRQEQSFSEFREDGRNAANTYQSRLEAFNPQVAKLGQKDKPVSLSRNGAESVYTESPWQDFPTVSPVCGGDDGLPKELDGITISKWRRESIKAYGNAIVPAVVHEIFKAIEASDD